MYTLTLRENCELRKEEEKKKKKLRKKTTHRQQSAINDQAKQLEPRARGANKELDLRALDSGQATQSSQPLQSGRLSAGGEKERDRRRHTDKHTQAALSVGCLEKITGK